MLKKTPMLLQLLLWLLCCCSNIRWCSALTVDSTAQIRNYINELRDDGSYKYQFDTTNGISQQESGVGGQYATGSSQFHTPDGQLIQLTYTADANGFQPQGAHLPTPPPIPVAIVKALEYIRTHPYREDTTTYQQQPHFQYQQPASFTKYGK